MKYAHCTRCHQAVKAENVVVIEGLGYGPTCAVRVRPQLELKPPRKARVVRRKRHARMTAGQCSLFDETGVGDAQ
jgi:hypothetical protein